jgi:hypothetical protein
MFKEDGCFRSDTADVVVERRRRTTDDEMYQIIAGRHIVLETDSRDLANGLAATFAALTPEGSPFKMETCLATIRDLTAARYLFAELVKSEASSLGATADAVRAVSRRLYGSSR